MTFLKEYLEQAGERADPIGYIYWLEKHIAELEKDRAFYKSCALSGEIPEEGAEPSAQKPREEQKP